MRILGIDPGLRRTGFGLIDVDGQRVRYVGSGLIRPAIEGTEPERLSELFSGVNALITQYKPDQAVIEREIIAPVSARLSHEKTRQSAEAAATKVDFFTLVRGED